MREGEWQSLPGRRLIYLLPAVMIATGLLLAFFDPLPFSPKCRQCPPNGSCPAGGCAGPGISSPLDSLPLILLLGGVASIPVAVLVSRARAYLPLPP
jgi:hypothetical protein